MKIMKIIVQFKLMKSSLRELTAHFRDGSIKIINQLQSARLGVCKRVRRLLSQSCDESNHIVIDTETRSDKDIALIVLNRYFKLFRIIF